MQITTILKRCALTAGLVFISGIILIAFGYTIARVPAESFACENMQNMTLALLPQDKHKFHCLCNHYPFALNCDLAPDVVTCKVQACGGYAVDGKHRESQDQNTRNKHLLLHIRARHSINLFMHNAIGSASQWFSPGDPMEPEEYGRECLARCEIKRSEPHLYLGWICVVISVLPVGVALHEAVSQLARLRARYLGLEVKEE